MADIIWHYKLEKKKIEIISSFAIVFEILVL